MWLWWRWQSIFIRFQQFLVLIDKMPRKKIEHNDRILIVVSYALTTTKILQLLECIKKQRLYREKVHTALEQVEMTMITTGPSN